MKKIANAIFYFFCVWYVCGFILVGLDILPSWLEWSNSVFIITAGILGVVYFMIRYSNGLGLIISALIFLTTFVIEYFGSTYEILFGSYTYTNQFAPNVFGVPIAIGFAWVMVIATGHAILSKLAIAHPLVRAMVGGLLALVMDLILDPVAFEVKGYWIWHEPGLYYNIPWTNFFGWFLIAFVLQLGLSYVTPKEENKLWQNRLAYLYVLIVVMFTFIGLMNSIYLASVIVLSCLVLLVLVLRKEAHYA